MTSNMLAGERRWASTKRSSMTVLGKVAVPKPLNLPSQRLENHGLDPNVEIVPKGSLSWGSRSSSLASNPWGSSGLSTHGDGANGSPSHVSGRPSSGGSGTRPSTADSDRMLEPTTSAWGPNSLPSSASGALTSNETSSTPLRPHSSETRPGSSQLSRFAEPLPDNSVAWGTGSVDKLIILSTKNDGFSLSSGDFPTLGSERENSGKNTESEDYGSHGCPSSSSCRVVLANDRTITSEADVKGGTMNTWKRDGTEHVEDGVQPSSEKWRGGDPQQYLNANVPQQFVAWHGSPINAPAGVWFRGPAGGPPYGPPVAPGGFPIEPFPYYRPQLPPPALGNPQQVPQSLNGPRGHHPKNGDLYRAQITDAYMHPGMPIRPGFYPLQVPYENYYGPPIVYCNPNERDIPFMGMATGPPVFKRYPAQNTPEPSNSHARAGGRGSSDTRLVSEQVESGQSDDTRGPYKVLIKQHNEWDTKEGSWEHTAPGNVPFLEKGSQTTFQKNERGSDSRRDEEMHSKRTPLDENSASINFDNRGQSLNSVGVKSPERVDKEKAVDDSWGKKSETEDSSLSQVLPAVLKDSTLLQKIKGLNDKARASNGCQDVAFAFSREDQKNRLQFDIHKANNSMNEVGTAVVCSESPHSGVRIAASNKAGVSKEHMIHQSTALTAISRREGQVDHRGKGRFNNPNADGWRKKPLVAECSTAIPTTNVGSVSTIHDQGHHTSMEAAERSETNLPVTDEGDFLAPMFDTSDCHAQMRERAKQCAVQLQKEEEERIREQKAKALAKLEELNRRAQASDGSTQKLEKAPPSRDILQDQEALQTLAETVMDAGRKEAPTLVLVSCRKEVAQTSDNSNSGVGESSVLSRNSHLETSKKAKQDTIVPQSSPSELDVHHAGAGAAVVTTAPQVNGSSASRHKSSGYKQKWNIQVEKHFTESLIPFGTIGEPNIYSSVALKDIISAETVPGEVVPGCEPNLFDNSNILPKSSAHQRKKIIKTGKNKSKLEDPLPVTALPSQGSREPNLAKASTESGKAKSIWFELDPGSVQSVAKAVAHLSDQPSSLPSEESHVKINIQRKAQQSRRMPRNGHANKVADKFHRNDAAVWAPVRSHHKAESADESSQKTVSDAVIVTAKGDNLGHNSIKSKRAEMERYVPKPVAKELAQQGSIQQSVSSSFSQTTSDEMVSREDSSFRTTESSLLALSVVENLGGTAESNSEDNKQNKQAKSHGAWRQRGSVESSCVQMGSSLTSNPSKNVQKYMDQYESLKPEVNQVKDEPNISDSWDTSDGWNMPEDPNAAPAVTFGMRDQGGVKGEGKRHPYKGHKSTGNKHDLDQKNNKSVEMNKNHIQSAALEISQEERSVTAKESGNGERASSHWQPKSQAYSANIQTGSRSSGGQHIFTQADQAIKKDSHPMDGDPPSTQDKEHSVVVPELHSDQSVSKNKCVGEAASNTRHQEVRRERKSASSKELPQHPSFGLVSTDEQAPPESGDAHLEQQISLGFRKHGNQNNRSGRGHESRGEWNSDAQDNRHCNVPGNREIQSQNSHYEYQPVGSHNFSKANNFEGPTTDGSRNMGSRYRERGRGHSRRGRGNSYGRQNGSIQVDAGYD